MSEWQRVYRHHAVGGPVAPIVEDRRQAALQAKQQEFDRETAQSYLAYSPKEEFKQARDRARVMVGVWVHEMGVTDHTPLKGQIPRFFGAASAQELRERVYTTPLSLAEREAILKALESWNGKTYVGESKRAPNQKAEFVLYDGEESAILDGKDGYIFFDPTVGMRVLQGIIQSALREEQRVTTL